MSYQIITKMAYNAETRQIETWQHSNNVWPKTDYFCALDATDDNVFNVVLWLTGGQWQARKWKNQLNTLYHEFPELCDLYTLWDYPGTYDDRRYWEHLAKVEAQRNKYAIVARFRELAKIA